MEVLLEVTGSEHLFSVFRIGAPNRNHVLMARLAAKGILRTIVTTNFDSLLERALEEEGISYTVSYTDAELENVDWLSSQLQVIKLHGDAGDSRSLAITIRRVASKNLISSRSKVLRELLSHDRVGRFIVLGYSFSDRFDINPVIASIEDKSKNVLIVSHENIDYQYASSFDLNAGDHAFRGFPGKILKCNSDDFMADLWEVFLEGKPPDLMPATIDWRPVVAHWYATAVAERGEAIGLCIAGLLCAAAGRYEDSSIFLHQALTFQVVPDLRVAIYQKLGDNYRDAGQYAEALSWLRKALELSDASGLLRRQARALSSLGIVMADLKDFGRAIGYYKRALKMARRARDRELEGKCNGNIGISRKNLGGEDNIRKAIRHQESALRIALELGDKQSEGRTLGNLGIAYSDLGDRPKAIQFYLEAFSVAEDLRDVRHMGIWMANAGMDYIGIDSGEATRLLHSAIEIFERLSLSHYVAECVDSLAKIEESDTGNSVSNPGPQADTYGAS